MATSPPPPPSHFSVAFFFTLIIVSTTIAASSTNDEISSATAFQELDITLDALRNRGHTLFTNAITTSDLRLQLLATAGEPTSQFTLFAPRNGPLFSLDMASDAASYVSTLRYHVIPYRRLTFSDLQNLTSPFLDTLLPHNSALIGQILDSGISLNNMSAGVMVDGVRVSEPDLFLGPRISVHGIDGILVTGLSIYHQDIDGNGSGLNITPDEAPAVSPPGIDWNIPSDGAQSPMPHFGWNIPAVPPTSSKPIENIPSVAPPLGRAEGVKSKRKKKQGKGHRKGGVHRRHRRGVHHRIDDL